MRRCSTDYYAFRNWNIRTGFHYRNCIIGRIGVTEWKTMDLNHFLHGSSDVNIEFLANRSFRIVLSKTILVNSVFVIAGFAVNASAIYGWAPIPALCRPYVLNAKCFAANGWTRRSGRHTPKAACGAVSQRAICRTREPFVRKPRGLIKREIVDRVPKAPALSRHFSRWTSRLSPFSTLGRTDDPTRSGSVRYWLRYRRRGETFLPSIPSSVVISEQVSGTKTKIRFACACRAHASNSKRLRFWENPPVRVRPKALWYFPFGQPVFMQTTLIICFWKTVLHNFVLLDGVYGNAILHYCLLHALNDTNSVHCTAQVFNVFRTFFECKVEPRGPILPTSSKNHAIFYFKDNTKTQSINHCQ